MEIHLVISAFTSKPTFLLASGSVSVLSDILSKFDGIHWSPQNNFLHYLKVSATPAFETILTSASLSLIAGRECH